MPHGGTLSYIFNMFIVKTCVLIRLPDLLNSPRLCLQIMLCNKGNQNRAAFSTQCFPFLPRGKSNSHQQYKEALRSTSISSFVFGVPIDRGGAKSGHRGAKVLSLGILEMITLSTHTASTDKGCKKYSTPSIFR